ncbi:hypothetical protein K432DRAFT_424700 [Lepidopterella palustris CBS 459.81]|uniref:Uncharacterized protein n=1 Tax=Lepidopterella palustris CBS 459.81 TaxID=1314670 RepID=A0A8E2JGR0_9PEZI|nr:hypothetical protein K432DRAFT_424700 [Lepidopterella palustris CBS 459.81]
MLLSTLLSTLAVTITALALPAAPRSTTPTYQLRVLTNNPTLNNTYLTTLETTNASNSNPLGIYLSLSSRLAPYQFRTSPAPGHFAYVTRASDSTHKATLIGAADLVAMQLVDQAAPEKLEMQAGMAKEWEKWLVFDNGGATELMLRYDSESFSASSWRACNGGQGGSDYDVFWYDGLNALPFKGCEAVSLVVEEVASNACR